MRRPPRYRTTQGFTLIELVLILTLMVIISSLGLPALQNLIGREKLLGSTRQASVGMRMARLEAIKTSRPTAVIIDTSDRSVTSFVDEDDDGALDLGERLLNRYTLPGGVYFEAPSGTDMTDIVVGFETSGTKGIARFNADGSVDAVGAFRMADTRGNYIEVRVEPLSVARVKLRKYDGTDWYGKDDSPEPWVWK